VLLKEDLFGTMYKMQGSTISDGCNSSIIPDIGVEEERNHTVSREKRLCYSIKDRGISERRVFNYYSIKVWLKVCLTTLWILIFVNIVYMGSKIG
jgi:hypothetical protein